MLLAGGSTESLDEDAIAHVMGGDTSGTVAMGPHHGTVAKAAEVSAAGAVSEATSEAASAAPDATLLLIVGLDGQVAAPTVRSPVLMRAAALRELLEKGPSASEALDDFLAALVAAALRQGPRGEGPVRMLAAAVPKPAGGC